MLSFEEIDESGLMNLELAIVNQARNDYVKGYIDMMENFGRILERDEMVEKFYKDYLSAIDFVKKDPYNIFQNMQDKILETWEEIAKERYEEFKEKKAAKAM